VRDAGGRRGCGVLLCGYHVRRMQGVCITAVKRKRLAMQSSSSRVDAFLALVYTPFTGIVTT